MIHYKWSVLCCRSLFAEEQKYTFCIIRYFITASFGHHSCGEQFLPADLTAADEVRPVKTPQS